MVRFVVDGGLSKAAAARQFNTTPKTVAKWAAVRATVSMAARSIVQAAHGQTAPATCSAVERGGAPATVSRILQRLGINKLSALEPAEPGALERDIPAN